MGNRQWWSILLAVTIYYSPLTTHAASLEQQAEDAWAKRADFQQTLKAIERWQDALKEKDASAEIWIRLTEAMGRAVRRSGTKASAKKWAEQARDTGKTAVEKNPSSAPAHAFYAEALGQWANTHKGLSSLKAVKQAVKQLDKAVDIDPKYGYAHMLLAEFYRKAPSSVSVGDKDKALHHAEIAATVEPDRAINRLAYARSLVEHGKTDAAMEQLLFIDKMTPRNDLLPETEANKEDAKKMRRCLEQNKGKKCAD